MSWLCDCSKSWKAICPHSTCGQASPTSVMESNVLWVVVHISKVLLLPGILLCHKSLPVPHSWVFLAPNEIFHSSLFQAALHNPRGPLTLLRPNEGQPLDKDVQSVLIQSWINTLLGCRLLNLSLLKAIKPRWGPKNLYAEHTSTSAPRPYRRVLVIE